MSKRVANLTAAVCLAVVTATASIFLFSSCSTPPGRSASYDRGSSYQVSSTLSRGSAPFPYRYAEPSTAYAPSRRVEAPVLASPSPQRVATTRRSFRPGFLFAWIFRVGFPDRADRTRNRSRIRREAREQQRTLPQRPAIPATQVNQGVLAKSNRSNTRVVIDISKQKAYLLVDGSVAIEAPVSTARPGKSTPRGTFRMGQRVRSGKVSTIYGVAMPYWMRLGGSVYGVHAGYLPGYPASAGCIRLPSDAARLIYDNTKSGTRVSIYSSWNRT